MAEHCVMRFLVGSTIPRCTERDACTSVADRAGAHYGVLVLSYAVRGIAALQLYSGIKKPSH
eukprot:7214652-Prymnesium_polylepis.1